jgi:hypothetical protein
MNALRRANRDPWWDDGVGARRARTRRRVTSKFALVVAIVACGLTAAAWIHTIAPTLNPLGLG